VSAVSSRAAERGVRLDMPVAEATSLINRRQLYVAQHDFVADREALEMLAGWCEQFSPQVALDAEDRPGGLLLDVTGLGPLFGGEGAMLRQIVRAFSREGWCVRVAMADTAGAAWAVAHFAERPRAAQRSIRDSSRRRWEVPQVVPAGETVSALMSLPCAALRISEATIERLASLGVTTIGQVTRLPRAGLSSRFDEELLRRLDQATGRRDEVIRAEHVPEALITEQGLECSTDSREAVEHVWRQLVDQLCEELLKRGEGALRLECSLELDDGQTLSMSVGTYRPVAASRHLKDLLELQWERLLLCEAVWKVSVSASVTARLERRQQALFADAVADGGLSDGPQREALSVLVDRLSSRLGREGVLTVSLTGDAVPEYGFRTRPVADRGMRRASPKKSAAATRSNTPAEETGAAGESTLRTRRGPRPLWVERRPQRIAVVAAMVVGETGPEGPPARFRIANTDHVVGRCWGPERIETGWWRGASVRRDYYRVETTAGLRFWLFRCRRQGEWFLHGMFD